MANTYTYSGPGTRWAEGDPTSEDKLNIARINLDHVYEALNTIMDTDAADGVVTGTVSGAVTLTGSTNNQLTTVTGAGAIAGEANLTFDGTTMNVVGNAGVGIARTDGTLHVHTASAGTATATGGADDIVIENSTHVGLQFLSPNTTQQTIAFGDPDSVTVGQLLYDHSLNHVRFDVAGNSRWLIDNTGQMLLAAGAHAETANAKMTVGLTINQGANDNEILALKSSDVAHGRVSMTETDTIFAVFKRSGTLGGVSSHFMAEDGAIDRVRNDHVSGGTANTAKTTAANGLTHIYMEETDGAGNVANITEDGNIFAVACRNSGADLTRFLIDEDGDMYSATTGQTFDAHDDIALVNNYDVIRAGMAEWNVENEAELVRLGILGAPIAEGGLTNVTQLQRLHNGAIRQLGEQNNALQLELNEMKQQLFLLQERN